MQAEIDELGVETDGNGWRAKVFLYCVEARCPQTGWMVPLLPTLIVSKGKQAIAELVPDPMQQALRHHDPFRGHGRRTGGGRTRAPFARMDVGKTHT